MARFSDSFPVMFGSDAIRAQKSETGRVAVAGAQPPADPPPRQDDRQKHERSFDQLRRLHNEAWLQQQNVDRTESKPDAEHDSDIGRGRFHPPQNVQSRLSVPTIRSSRLTARV